MRAFTDGDIKAPETLAQFFPNATACLCWMHRNRTMWKHIKEIGKTYHQKRAHGHGTRLQSGAAAKVKALLEECKVHGALFCFVCTPVA